MATEAKQKPAYRDCAWPAMRNAAPPPGHFSCGKDHASWPAGAARNLSASWLFSGATIALTGSFGALLAASLFTSVASCVGLAAYFGRRGLVTRALVGSAARILCVGGIAALLAAPLPVPELAGRAGMAAMVSLRVLFFGGLYLVGLSLTGEWDDQDRYFLSNATGILKPRRED